MTTSAPPIDPLAGSQWSAPGTVAGFAQAGPNPVLLRFAEQEFARTAHRSALDIGCGAARNALPLAALGWRVVGTDLSWPMLCAARDRMREERVEDRFQPVLAPMEAIPVRDSAFGLIVAHGIWNLARSAAQFRRAVDEAARAAAPGAALFVFTFSRHTLPDEAAPLSGEPFVFTQFSGQPQCFLTEQQLDAELARAGFSRDPAVPLTEYNGTADRTLSARSGPVIYEALFRFEHR